MERSGRWLIRGGSLLYLLRTLRAFGQSVLDGGGRRRYARGGRVGWLARVAVVGIGLAMPGLGLTRGQAAGRAGGQATGEEDFSTLLREGFQMHQRADYGGALRLLEQARRLRPHDYFANLLVGIDLLRTGRAAESIGPLEEASRREPREDIPLAYLGEAEGRAGRFAEAAGAYARAVEVGSGSAQAGSSQAGSSQAGSSQTVESAISFSMDRFRTLLAGLRSTSRGLAADYRLQAMAQRAEDPKRSEMLLDAVSLDPEAPGIWSELAIAGAAAGREVEARGWLERATRADRNDQRAKLAQALLAARGGDWTAVSSDLGEMAEHSAGALGRAVPEWPRTLKPGDEGAVTGVARSFLTCVREAPAGCDLRRKDGAGVRTMRVAAGDQGARAVASHAGRAGSGAAAGVLFREQRWERVADLPAPAAGDVQGWFGRGVALAEMGRWTAAVAALERALTRRDKSVAGMARAETRKVDVGAKGADGGAPGDRVDRVDGVERVVGDERFGAVDGVYAQFLLSWAYARWAAEMMQLLERGSSDQASVHLIKGDVLLRMQGSSKGAIAEYRAGLKLRGDDPTLLERLAEAQMDDRQPEAAVESAKAALRIDPQRFTAMRTLARVAMEQRDYKAALPYLLQLTAHDPDDAAVQVELGTVDAETGDARGAIEQLQPALERGYPDERGSLHAMLGTVLRKLGRTDESARAFAQARVLSEGYQSRPHGSSDEQR